MPMNTDTIDQAVADFSRDGFVVLRQFFSREKMFDLESNLKRFIDEVLPEQGAEAAFYEDKSDPSTLFRLQHLTADAYFHDFLHCDALVNLASALLDDVAIPQELQLFAKAPRLGNVTPPHQDGYYWRLTPNEGVTVWMALDSVDEENGCVRYVPGSHREGMRRHEAGEVFGFSMGIPDYGEADEAREVSVCVEPGDIIVHHALTIHRADKNESDRQRRSLGPVYFAQRAKHDSAPRTGDSEDVRAAWRENGRI